MRPLDGYPDSFGAHRASVFPHAGPASYTQITRGTPPTPATGGDTASAAEAGFKFFEHIGPSVTDSGNYRVEPIPTTRSGVVGQQATTYRLKWVALVTASLGGQSQTINTEAVAATDLSAEIVRLTALGYK